MADHLRQRACAILNSGKQRQQIALAVEAGHRAAGELAGSTLGGDSPAEDRPAYLAAAEACRRQETIERWLAAKTRFEQLGCSSEV